MRNYQQAAEYLGGKDGRPLANNTRLERRADGAIAVKLHSTDVVTYRPDGSAELQSGGWRTVTTKDRINTYSPARVYSERGAWYLQTGPGWEKAGRVTFYDGIRVDLDGAPIGPAPAGTDTTELQRKLDKAVSKYIKAYAAAMSAGEVGEPGAGDCWGCLFQVKDAHVAKPGGWGQRMRPTMHGRVEPMGIGHYLEHIGLGEDPTELYLVPSLLWNAITARGYGDPRVIAAMIWRGKDGRMAADVLRAFFRNLKPALVAELQGRPERCEYCGDDTSTSAYSMTHPAGKGCPEAANVRAGRKGVRS